MNELKFEKNADGAYECEIASNTSGTTVQVERVGNSPLVVLAALDGMPLSVVARLENPYSGAVIFHNQLPDGIRVVMRCQSEIVKAVWK